jgi:MinD superfamily P-loop ATPase
MKFTQVTIVMGKNDIRIAVLSGKGGTGKTLLSVNLAAVADSAKYIDCDVEEPNGHLFFKPEKIQEQAITVKIPEVDQSRCDGCRICVDFCMFNALALVDKKLMLFDEICHSCGGCALLCPQKALTEKDKVIGRIQSGVSERVTIKSGFLNPGEASGVPIIEKLLSDAAENNDCPIFIDCPPGSACIVMESIKDADYCVLVAEPTLFGVHNLNMVYELVKLFDKPFGVVLNKCLEGENPAEKYCVEKNIKILGRIPFDKELGKLNANGQIAARESSKYKELFFVLLQKIAKEAGHEAIINS